MQNIGSETSAISTNTLFVNKSNENIICHNKQPLLTETDM